MIFCPHCNKRISHDPFNTDIVHECSQTVDAPDVVKQDDVVVIGNWNDGDTSGIVYKQDVMRQGGYNELFGTRAGILGNDKEKLTKHGARDSTHRQTNHSEFIDIKTEDK